MHETVRLQVGTKVVYDGEIVTILGLDASTIRIRGARGNEQVTLLPEFIRMASAPLDHGTDDLNRSAAGSHGFPLTGVPKEALRVAETHQGHLLEARTGYRSGSPELAVAGEPKPEYDPKVSKSLRVRMDAKAVELGVNVRTLWRQSSDYDEQGLWGLVDKRTTKALLGRSRFDPRLLAAVETVRQENIRKSTPTKVRLRRLTIDKVKELFPGEDVKVPDQRSFDRMIDEVGKGKAVTGSAKRRRNIADTPEGRYKSLRATRPGEYVLIDSTPLDVFALDLASGLWVQLELTIALDLYTRSLLAWRFTPKNPKGVDAALLLHDLLEPVPMRPGWPEDARWRFHGVPEHVVVDVTQVYPENTALAGVPVVDPTTVVVDRGRVFVSRVFIDACARLGVSVQFARPRTPTDKPQVEAVFRTIRENLLEYLDGYKGPDVYSRGEDPGADAFYTVDEIEEIFAEWVVRVYQVRTHSGLSLANAPHVELSPNEMYDAGLLAAGFVNIPADPGLLHELLPVHWRTMQRSGVEIDGLTYWAQELEGRAFQKSSYGGAQAGKWPIHVDPRDLSRAWMLDPETREWVELEWHGAPLTAAPFDNLTLTYAKQLTVDRIGRAKPDPDELAETLADILDRARQGTGNRVEQRLAVKRASRSSGRKQTTVPSGTPAQPDPQAEPGDRLVPSAPPRKNRRKGRVAPVTPLHPDVNNDDDESLPWVVAGGQEIPRLETLPAPDEQWESPQVWLDDESAGEGPA